MTTKNTWFISDNNARDPNCVSNRSFVNNTRWVTKKWIYWDLRFSADKLLRDVDNIVTFYVDNRIDNEFMRNAVRDVQAMSDKDIPTTESQVTKNFWSGILTITVKIKSHLSLIISYLRWHLSPGQKLQGKIFKDENSKQNIKFGYLSDKKYLRYTTILP